MSLMQMKCANCGAALQITNEISNFSCSYCGVQQMVVRSGGVVSLRLVSAIAKVQKGTDRTAAELAIRRLKEEIAVVNGDLDRLETNNRIERNNATTNYGLITIGVLIVGFVATVAMMAMIGYCLVITVVPVIIITTVVLVGYGKKMKEIDNYYNITKNELISERESLDEELQENYDTLAK